MVATTVVGTSSADGVGSGFPPHKRTILSSVQSLPQLLQTWRKLWTACSHSSSVCATHSTYLLPTSPASTYLTAASTATRVFPAPVGRLIFALASVPRMATTGASSSTICVWYGCSGPSGMGPDTESSAGRFSDGLTENSGGKPSAATKSRASCVPHLAGGFRPLSLSASDKC